MKNILVVTALLILSIVLLSLGLLAVQSTSGLSPVQAIENFLGLDSLHIWWYITRASGLMAYLLVWLSTLWGFAISSKVFDAFLKREFTYDLHEHLSLLSLGFVILHVVVLLLDRVEPLRLVEVLIPFVSSYRPFWTGIGIVAFYLSILVTVTFYLRKRISMKTFRTIHYLSIVAYLGALLHGLYARTDSLLSWTQMMYWGTLLSTVFFGVYWLVVVRLQKREKSNTQIRIQEASALMRISHGGPSCFHRKAFLALIFPAISRIFLCDCRVSNPKPTQTLHNSLTSFIHSFAILVEKMSLACPSQRMFTNVHYTKFLFCVWVTGCEKLQK